MRIIRLSIIFFISVFLLILALLNRQYVDFRFFPVNLSDQMGILGGASIPLFLLILGSVLLGLLLGFFGEYLREHKHRKALSQKTKKKNKLCHRQEHEGMGRTDLSTKIPFIFLFILF